MGQDQSIKNLVGRTERDLWTSITGRRPESYRIDGVGISLMSQVDHALLERDLHQALTAGIVFGRWAEHDLHFKCKAPAVMGAVYTVCEMMPEAEKQLSLAKSRVDKRRCKDCSAQYCRRRGIYLIYDRRPQESLRSYDRAVRIFEEIDDTVELAKCLMGRGVVKSIMHDFEDGLADQERGIGLLVPEGNIFIVAGSVNMAAILTKMGAQERAREKISEVQEMLKGIKHIERPKLVIRWIKSLLLEDTGKRKDLRRAQQMLDRVEERMKNLNMKAEIRVLLADRARMARDRSSIIRIASKAYENETSEKVRAILETIVREPRRERIIDWRNALNSYVPPFPTAI